MKDWKHIFKICVQGRTLEAAMKLITFFKAVWFMARSGCQWPFYHHTTVHGEPFTEDLKIGVIKGFDQFCLIIL